MPAMTAAAQLLPGPPIPLLYMTMAVNRATVDYQEGITSRQANSPIYITTPHPRDERPELEVFINSSVLIEWSEKPEIPDEVRSSLVVLGHLLPLTLWLKKQMTKLTFLESRDSPIRWRGQDGR